MLFLKKKSSKSDISIFFDNRLGNSNQELSYTSILKFDINGTLSDGKITFFHGVPRNCTTVTQYKSHLKRAAQHATYIICECV